MKNNGLTPKQQRFVEEYLLDLNATQAAIRAGYSKRYADRQAHQLLEKTRVSTAIQSAVKARSVRTQITQDRVLEELARIAFGDTTEIIKIENGKVVMKDTDQLTEDQRRIISEISETISEGGGRTKKIKTYDKQRALELLGRHLSLFTDKVELSGAVASAGLAELVRSAADDQQTGGSDE